ncbi:MAG: glycosyltransferase, partial [Gemmatimonadota bacterium]|nr:glycosyltransferase [Gemmatimonadota bacterium]
EIAVWYREARALAGPVSAMRSSDHNGSTLWDVLRRHNIAVTTSNFFLHRELWRRLGGFRAYRYVHDYDFLLRAVELCPDRVVYEDRLGDVLYRVHGVNTISEANRRAQAERREMMGGLAKPSRRLRRMLVSRSERRAVAEAVRASDSLDPVGMSEHPSRPSASGRDSVRLGLLVESLGTGGLEEVVALLAGALPSVGVDPCILCAREGGAVANRLKRAGTDVEVLRGGRGALRGWVEQSGVDVVSSHFGPAAIVAELAEMGLPVVETVQNSYAWFTADDWARERERAQATHGVIAVSRVAGAYYRRHTGRDPGWIVPNAVHPARVARVPRGVARALLGIGEGVPVFAFVGRVTQQKNPRGLLEAFASAVRDLPNAVLLLAGPADRSASLPELRRTYRGLFDSGAVRTVSAPRHVGTVLSAADGFVANSFYEGWSVAASEALWVGLPVVLSDVGGSAELVGSASERGLLIPNPSGDPLEVTQASVTRPPVNAWRERRESCSGAGDHRRGSGSMASPIDRDPRLGPRPPRTRSDCGAIRRDRAASCARLSRLGFLRGGGRLPPADSFEHATAPSHAGQLPDLGLPMLRSTGRDTGLDSSPVHVGEESREEVGRWRPDHVEKRLRGRVQVDRVELLWPEHGVRRRERTETESSADDANGDLVTHPTTEQDRPL